MFNNLLFVINYPFRYILTLEALIKARESVFYLNKISMYY